MAVERQGRRNGRVPERVVEEILNRPAPWWPPEGDDDIGARLEVEQESDLELGLERIGDPPPERVERAAHDLMARQRAQAVIAFQRLPNLATPPDAGWSARRELALVEDEVNWRIRSLVATGDNVSIVAREKAGKTTLMLNLVRALLEGGDFLASYEAKPLDGSLLFINYEMDKRRFRRWMRDLALSTAAAERLIVVHARGKSLPLWNENVAAVWARWARSRGIQAVILDPAAHAWRGYVRDERDNTNMVEFLALLDNWERSAGVEELYLPHHMAKGAQELDEETGRGAVALHGWADVNWFGVGSRRQRPRSARRSRGDRRERQRRRRRRARLERRHGSAAQGGIGGQGAGANDASTVGWINATFVGATTVGGGTSGDGGYGGGGGTGGSSKGGGGGGGGYAYKGAKPPTSGALVTAAPSTTGRFIVAVDDVDGPSPNGGGLSAQLVSAQHQAVGGARLRVRFGTSTAATARLVVTGRGARIAATCRVRRAGRHRCGIRLVTGRRGARRPLRRGAYRLRLIVTDDLGRRATDTGRLRLYERGRSTMCKLSPVERPPVTVGTGCESHVPAGPFERAIDDRDR